MILYVKHVNMLKFCKTRVVISGCGLRGLHLGCQRPGGGREGRGCPRGLRGPPRNRRRRRRSREQRHLGTHQRALRPSTK